MKLDYELLDFGEGFRLERFGHFVLKRPAKELTEAPGKPLSAWKFDAECIHEGSGHHVWNKSREDVPDRFDITLDDMRLELRLSQSKNIGIFPEQLRNWMFIKEKIQKAHKPFKLLNLFGYTGAASLVAAKAGAEVTHVDSAKSTVKWAAENYKRNGQTKGSVRFITDDALKFLSREAKRGAHYDGVIFDPPPFGRSKAGSFTVTKDAAKLLGLIKSVVGEKPKFLLSSSYAQGHTPKELETLIRTDWPQELKSGVLSISARHKKIKLTVCAFACSRN